MNKGSRREREMRRYWMTIGLSVAAALIIAGITLIVKARNHKTIDTSESVQTATVKSSTEAEDERVTGLIEQARLYAMGYDYDKAIEYIKSDEAYKSTYALLVEVENLQNEKKTLVEWSDVRTIPHIFIYPLVADEKKAAASDQAEVYESTHITVTEFKNLLNELYENDYVLIRMTDMAVLDEDGTFSWGSIMLPEGKKPLIMSEENVCYTDTMAQDGFASKLVLTDDGSIMCELADEDGTSTGLYDAVPILEEFIAEHPDFSYRQARMLLGVSGADGVFGYDVSDETEKAEASNVAEALRNLGYELGCNGYHYTSVSAMEDETFQDEIEKWLDETAEIVGETDIFIYPEGADVGDWHYYSGGRYQQLKDYGFNYFVNMNSSEKSWNQILDAYVRQGRRCVSNENLLADIETGTVFEDLFDSSKVYEK